MNLLSVYFEMQGKSGILNHCYEILIYELICLQVCILFWGQFDKSRNIVRIMQLK